MVFKALFLLVLKHTPGVVFFFVLYTSYVVFDNVVIQVLSRGFKINKFHFTLNQLQ